MEVHVRMIEGSGQPVVVALPGDGTAPEKKGAGKSEKTHDISRTKSKRSRTAPRERA